MSKILKKFPGYLHRLYRVATKELGANASNTKIFSNMNTNSKLWYPDCPIRCDLGLTMYHFVQFFNECGGSYIAHTSQPLLTREQKQARMDWVSEILKLMENNEFFLCFLDEKWFYATTRRRRYKILPPGPGETLQDAFVRMPKCPSRRFPTKVMFLGVVAPPDEANNFDGKIHLRRVCEKVARSRQSHSRAFSDDYHTNKAIVDGEWKALHRSDCTPNNLAASIQARFDLEDDVTERLVWRYRTISGKRLAIKYLLGTDDASKFRDLKIKKTKNGPLQQLQVNDLELLVRNEGGVLVEKDVNIDSDFMLQSVDEIGGAIRNKMAHVPKHVPIHLVMDNAGGHGTKEAKKKYVSKFREKYNIIIFWQCPNSPETNLLDLGAWRSLQSAVEDEHLQKRIELDVLAKSVMAAWDKFDGNAKLGSIYERWKKVLSLIQLGNGNNDLVEKFRGKTTHSVDNIPVFPMVDDGDDERDG